MTRILSAIELGEENASDKLFSLVYQELRKLAAAKLANEKPGQTLQATALVHVAYWGKTISVRDCRTGIERLSLEGRTSGVSSIAFSPDGARIISGSNDKTIKFWDAGTGRCLRTVKRHTSTTRLWEANPRSEVVVLKGHPDHVHHVSFSDDGTMVYSRDVSGTKIVWDAQTRQQIKDIQWKFIEQSRLHSQDKRWRVTSSGKDVLLIDMEFRDSSDQIAYREFKSRLDPEWHAAQAAIAEKTEDWYAAVFHHAWVMKSDTDQAAAFDRLQESYEQLKKAYSSRNEDCDVFLHPVVVDMLRLVR